MTERNSKKWELHSTERATSALDLAKEFIKNSELLPEGNAFLVSEQIASSFLFQMQAFVITLFGQSIYREQPQTSRSDQK